MSYRFYVTMNPPAVAYNWQYGGGYSVPDIKEIEGEFVEVDDNGHLVIIDAADQVVFAAANGAWLSCNLAEPVKLPETPAEALTAG